MRDSFDSAGEDQVVKLIDDTAIHEAEDLIVGCEVCSKDAWLPFDYVLNTVTGDDPVSDYIMRTKAKCPCCRYQIRERSLVKPVE
jgi:hypothetical protein